jgi:hypothetical protein
MTTFDAYVEKVRKLKKKLAKDYINAVLRTALIKHRFILTFHTLNNEKSSHYLENDGDEHL